MEPADGESSTGYLRNAFLVAVDIRKSSPTWVMGRHGDISPEQEATMGAAWIRVRFCVLSDFAEVQYKCTSIYNHEGESGIHWMNPELAIDWPIRNCIVSRRTERPDSQPVASFTAVRSLHVWFRRVQVSIGG